MTNNKPARRSAKRPYGPNIVRAWFDTVFHYILGGLETEKGFLVRHNWTFRHNNGTLEYIAPIVKQVPSEAVANLEQFVSFFPEVGRQIDRHDECVQRLQGCCVAYSDAIVRDGHFLATFQRVAAESPQVLKREFESNFGAYSSSEDFKRILAEHLVNNLESLFSYHATAVLWNRYRQDFASAVATPELGPFRDATDRSGCEMLEVCDELLVSMKRTRNELSLAFDVPFVAELSSVR